MFEQPRYIQNNFNIVFPRVIDMRRKAFDLEEKLKNEYVQPQIISIPDELEPQLPRIAFDSRSGYSQIFVSQISISLNVTYSPDFQIDSQKRLDYLKQRVPILFTLFEILEDVKPYFSGLSTIVHLPSHADNQEVLDYLAHVFLKTPTSKNVHDLQVKVTSIIEQRFFSNMIVENYRIWSPDVLKPGIVQLSQDTVKEQGISITNDFNDRYAFNENGNYRTSRDLANRIIELAYQEIDTILYMVKG